MCIFCSILNLNVQNKNYLDGKKCLSSTLLNKIPNKGDWNYLNNLHPISESLPCTEMVNETIGNINYRNYL